MVVSLSGGKAHRKPIFIKALTDPWFTASASPMLFTHEFSAASGRPPCGRNLLLSHWVPDFHPLTSILTLFIWGCGQRDVDHCHRSTSMSFPDLISHYSRSLRVSDLGVWKGIQTLTNSYKHYTKDYKLTKIKFNDELLRRIWNQCIKRCYFIDQEQAPQGH